MIFLALFLGTFVTAVVTFVLHRARGQAMSREIAIEADRANAVGRADALEARVKLLTEHLMGRGLPLPLELAPTASQCRHVAAVAVESGLPAIGVPMTVVAWWCPKCATQLSAEPQARIDKRRRDRENEWRTKMYEDRALRDVRYQEFMEEKFG